MPNQSPQIVSTAVSKRRKRGEGGRVHHRRIAGGMGWQIADILCTCGADDPVGEECHQHHSLTMVLAGAFRYRGTSGSADLAPGSLLLCRPAARFRCWHEYGDGDRCLAVQFDPDTFEDIVRSAGFAARSDVPLTVPVLKSTAGLFAFAEQIANRGLEGRDGTEVAHGLAERMLRVANGVGHRRETRTCDARRIMEIARWIESDPAAPQSVEDLADRAGLSKFHFIRAFKSAVGLSPYAFITRARTRDASKAIAFSDSRIADIALDSGFSDLSTFNHRFKGHFGISPTKLRACIQDKESRLLMAK